MNDFGSQVQRDKSLRVLNAVWLYDEDEECRRLVDESPEYGVYAHEALRKQDATLHSFGEDYARVVAPAMADEPMGLVEQTLAGMPEARRGVYQGEFDRLRLSGKDTRQDYYALYGKLVRDEVRGQYAEQQRVQRQQAERLEQVVSDTLAGRGGVPTPEDYTLLAGAGIDYKDLQLAGAVATAARMGMTAEQQADILFEQNASPAARQMALQQITADALEAERKSGERGFFENMVGSFSSTGEAIEDVAKSILPSERNMMHPDMMRGADGEWLSGAQVSERVSNRAAWRSRVREAVESGRGQAREEIGFRVSSMPSNLASGLVRLAPWLVPTPAAKGQGVMRLVGRVLADMSTQGLAAGGLVTDSLSQGYGVQQAARDDGDDSIGDAEVAGKAVAATVAGSIPMGGGSWLVRNGVGRLLPQGMTWGARALSKAPVAYGVNAAATTATFGATLPAVEYGLNALYDLAPWQDDRLDTGVRDLKMLGEQMGSGSYWAEQGLLGAVLGAPAAAATRGRALMYLGNLKGALSEGITRKQFESTIRMKPAEQMRELENIRRRNLEENAEGSIRQAVEEARALVDRERAVQMRTDEAIRAAMEEYGLSVGAAEQDGMVNLYYGGEVQPDGSFKRGEKFVTLTREDADVYLQASIGYKLEGTARMLRQAAGGKRLLDAFRDELKGEVRVEWMREADSLAKFEGWKERALERIEVRTTELVADGMDTADARRKAEGEVHKDISDRGTLGELVRFATNMRERFEQEQASRGVELDPQAFSSRANVTRQRSADGSQLRRVLRIAHDARVDEIAEELGEQVMYDWRESQGMSVTEAYRYLRAFADWAKQSKNAAVSKAAGKLLSLDKTHPELAARLMADDFNEYDLSVDEYRAVERELTEAGSTLMLSELRQAAADGQMPGWAHELFGMADLSLLELERDMNLAMAMEEARAEGVLPEAAQKLFGAGREAVEAALREEPEVQEYHQAWYEVQKRQSELDAAYGAGKLTEPSITEDFEARARQGQEALEREREEAEARAAEAARERLEEYAAEPENAGKSHEEVVQEAAEHAADAAEERLQGEPGAERDADFAGGLCLEITDEGGLVCKSGLLEVGKLQVLPNFKLGADADSGVVHPLKGDYRPDHDPIRVWRKADGALLVISGRHRLDAAKRAGATRISAYVYDESEVRDLAWARRYDIESNIRDNQATPLEVALYVRGEFTGGKPLSNEEVERAGITREGKLGSIGFRIGRRAGESVMDALRNGTIDDRVALWIADFCPGNDAVQRRGLEVALRDGSKAEVLARMEAELAKQQMQEEMGLDGGADLFGNTLDNDEFMDFVAQYVLRRRNELAQDASYLNATAKKRNAEAMGKKYGVDVKDPVALKKKLAEINALRERWKNPYSDSELMDEIRAAWRSREGENMPADAAANKLEHPSEKLFREYASMDWKTERTDYSTVYQRDVIDTLRSSGKHDAFYDAVDMLQRNGKPHDSQANSPASYAAVADRLRNEVLALSNGEIDLEKGSHSVSVSDLWHSYSKHCLDSFIEDGHLNLTHDDLRMIPDIVENYDSVKLINAKKGYTLEFTKEYGEVVYVVAETIAGKNESPRGTRQKTIYLNEITKKASSKAFHPTPFSKNFTRTEIVNPVTTFIKQNYAAEARKIAKKMRDSKHGMVAPNGKPSKLSPELWVATRLQSFKNWFGDWENDPENASKVVDENGEPLVVYHGTRSDFKEFDLSESGASNTYAGVGFWFSTIKGFGERFAWNSWWGDGDAREMALFLNLRNPKVFETRKDEDYGDAYERFRTDVVSLLGKDAEFANIGGLGMAWYRKTGKMGIPEYMDSSEKREVLMEYRDKLKAEGYDGILIKQTEYDYSTAGSENDQYVAFESNQIKSATDNQGTFDASSTRIDFSVIGPNAATWDKYRDRMFTGRDDGMLRAEIDASGAKLKNLGVSDEYAEQEAGMLLWKVNKFVKGLSAEKRELLEKYIEVYKSDYPAENREEARKEEIRLEEANKETLDALHAELGGMVDRMWIEAILPGVDYREVEMRTQVREYYEKNIRLGERRYLRDVLDFEELYEAYPHLRHISVSFEKLSAGTNAQVVRSNGKDSIVLSESLLRYPERQMLSSLLHEVQHMIQGIEGFAQGGNEYSARIAANNKRRYPFTEWIDGKSDYELYQRLAGEIEARNVQHRMDWPMDERDSYPFNSTLEYPGEAIVTHYSICGLRAKTANEYLEKGADYVDPADGQRKFVIPVRGARLRSDVTPGMLNVAAGGHKDVSLAALLHYPELYRAYPQLAEMRVRLYRPVEETSVGGYFSPEEGSEQAAYIAVNVAYRSEILNTLLHESQHAIQQLEGFAMGAGSFDQARALAYIGKAIEQRREAGVNDDWSRDNLAFLELLQAGVESGDETSITLTYVMSHGEQEARFTGEGYGTEGSNPMADGSAEPLMKSRPSSYTVAVRKHATDLGGVTFLNMGRFGYLLDDRLMPAGEFHFDRRVYQMRENVMRRMRELRSQTDGSEEADGLRLAAEGLAVMDSIESLLPNTYRAALEPYKVYFNTYAKLRGSGDAGKAAATVPMTGWDAKMYSSFYGMVYRLISGKAEAHGEFWEHAFRDVPGAEEGMEAMREVWEEVHEQVEAEYAERLADAPNAKAKGKIKAQIETETFTRIELEFSEEMNKLFQALGSMRADRLMAKFLERVALQLDAFRKDTTLGRIRRVVNALTPLPGKDGKPVKGRMAAEAYNKVMDMMRLLELTKGQKLAFERTRYTGEEDCPDGRKVWAELEPDELITVDTYDADGESVVVTCTKQEYETYACFDGMTAAQAESAGKALGEFITTGRQAWDNMEELRRQRIAKMCTPLMEEHAETLNDERRRHQAEKRGVLPMTSWARKVHALFGSWMNDAQFFDAMTGVKEVEVFARDFTNRMARAKVYIESKEKERRSMMMDAVFKASGAKDGKEAREFIDYINRTEKTKIVLRPQEPDFLEQETAELRAQFLGLLRRKTHKKNFSPNTFAAMMKHLEAQGDEIIPAHILDEAMAKYGEIGDAKKSMLHGIEAMASVLTQQEFSRFHNLTKAAKKRADKAREKWMEEKLEKDAGTRPEDEGGLELTRSEAAYRVLLCQQADYEETLRRQGYTESVVRQLEVFAGEKMMTLAYRLRDELGARTQQIKEVYERVYGMPFPEVENYFRAYFNAGYEVHSEAIMGGAGEGRAAGKGTAKILYSRHHHNAKIDPTMNVLTAFECAMKEQDIMLGYEDLPTDISSVLNYRDGDLKMSDALAKVFSSHTVGEMKLIADNMTRAVPAAEETARWMTRCLSALGSSTATAILNYRVGTLFKQKTALFNTLAGSDRVSWWEWQKSLGRARVGLSKISMKEMAARPELDSRFKGWSASADAEALLGDADVISAKGATNAAARAGMSLMEWIDVRENVRSCVALYDAVYRKMQKEYPEMSHEELDADAMNEVRRALAFKSQPLDWRSRALLGSKRSLFSIGNLFLGGESINTMGNVLRLMARGKKGDKRKAFSVWFTHGVALQVLTAIYNWMTDDEEQWERRSWKQYVAGSVLGPLAGLPLVGAFVGAGTGVLNTFLPKEARVWMPTQSLLPMADMERVASDIRKVFWGRKPSSWQDKTIAVENFIRVLATFGILASRNPTTAGGAKLKAMSYGVAAVTNILDFLLRTERAVEERAMD